VGTNRAHGWSIEWRPRRSRCSAVAAMPLYGGRWCRRFNWSLHALAAPYYKRPPTARPPSSLPSTANSLAGDGSPFDFRTDASCLTTDVAMASRSVGLADTAPSAARAAIKESEHTSSKPSKTPSRCGGICRRT